MCFNKAVASYNASDAIYNVSEAIYNVSDGSYNKALASGSLVAVDKHNLDAIKK